MTLGEYRGRLQSEQRNAEVSGDVNLNAAFIALLPQVTQGTSSSEVGAAVNRVGAACAKY